MKRTFQVATLLLVLAFSLAGCVTADKNRTSPEAKGSEDYATEMQRLLPLAKQGDAVAQSELGVMYAKGLGVPQDYDAALKWFRLAADDGYAKAQFNLGIMYDNGLGVQRNQVSAAKWFRMSADQGYDLAQFNLGYMYALGEGLPHDNAAGLKWLRLAADQGLASAQYNLGLMYCGCLGGGPVDYVQAYLWVGLAAAQNHKGAAEERDKIAKKLTSQQLAEVQRLVREWKPKTL